jgi:hypothetical protein
MTILIFGCSGFGVFGGSRNPVNRRIVINFSVEKCTYRPKIEGDSTERGMQTDSNKQRSKDTFSMRQSVGPGVNEVIPAPRIQDVLFSHESGLYC